MTKHPEIWLRGESLDPHPLRHLLLCTLSQASEEIERAVSQSGAAALWTRPYGLPPLGFHIRHIAESIDRLLTYAEGQSLSPSQLATLRLEAEEELSWPELSTLTAQRLREADLRVRALDLEPLDRATHIGRAQIEVPLGALLAHIAEHTQRHLGQIATMRRLLQSI